MKINNKLIKNLADLAKLKFNKTSSEEIKSDLEKMIGFIDKLSEINTDGVEPLIYLSDEVNVFRDDKVSSEVSQKEALKNAPEKDSDYFKVPTVLKK